jgi:hypothetical protein
MQVKRQSIDFNLKGEEQDETEHRPPCLRELCGA